MVLQMWQTSETTNKRQKDMLGSRKEVDKKLTCRYQMASISTTHHFWKNSKRIKTPVCTIFAVVFYFTSTHLHIFTHTHNAHSLYSSHLIFFLSTWRWPFFSACTFFFFHFCIFSFDLLSTTHKFHYQENKSPNS